jgi:AcrR family transcriptional regulator
MNACQGDVEFMIVPPELKMRKEPKQARSRKLIETVLDAALLIIDEQGISSFNTNAVAKAAGVDIASIYQYLPNKESILFWAAERWLRRIREACNEMDSSNYQKLNWRDFFAAYGEKVNSVPESRRAFISMQSLWVLYPEYQALEREHQEFMVSFLMKHFRRFGAATEQDELHSMTTYLYLTSNMVITAAQGSASASEAEGLNTWNYRVWIMLLEAILPSS